MTPESLKRSSREEDLKEFSGNGFGREETVWCKPVTTTNPKFSKMLASNDSQLSVNKNSVVAEV